MPAIHVILFHLLLSLSGYKELIEQKQWTIPHLIGLSYQVKCVLLDETFYQLLINEHYKLCEYHSSENIQKWEEEEEKLQAEKYEKA